jgi:hypothetical protein
MGKESAVRAYRDSVYDVAVLQAETRISMRTIPIIGGLVPGLKLLGAEIYRPFKVLGALMFGYEDVPRDFPAMPPVPAAFQDTDLGRSFEQSWKLKKEAAQASITGFAKLMDLEVTQWWQNASVASHAEAKDRNAVFAEEGEAMRRDNSAGAGFVAALMASRGDSGMSR